MTVTLRNSLVPLVLGMGLLGLSPARALSVQALVEGTPPALSRVGAFVLSSAGKPTLEVASAPLQREATAGNSTEQGSPRSRITLEFPTGALESRLLSALTPDAVNWNGIVGQVKVDGGPKYAELRLFLYTDANNSGKHEVGEKLLEADARLGRSSVMLVYLDSPTTVSADKGFVVSLNAGFQAMSIETGRTIKGEALEKVRNLELRF